MADTTRQVDYYYVTVSNQPGEGARLVKTLKDAGVNLRALHAFPRDGQAQIDLVPDDAAVLETAAENAKIQLTGPKRAFLIEGEDRPGAAAELLDRLAGAGISVTAMDAVAAGGGRYGALLWVGPTDIARAASALGAS